MSFGRFTRANNFDRLVGKLQTGKVIEFGVGNSILDVGCGIGEYTPLYLTRFKRVVGLDPERKYLAEARKANKVIKYVRGWGETFKTKERFDTISLNHILEHAEEPIKLLKNCRLHLKYGGRIIVQVPNCESVTRRLGILMGVIPGETHISEKERDTFGHKRTYDIHQLESDCKEAYLEPVISGGLLYKPLPNDDLWELYQKKGDKFIDALVKFGEDRPRECACLYVVCESQ